MKKLKLFEDSSSIDYDTEQVQHLLSGIKNFYRDFKDSVEPKDIHTVGEDGAMAWALEEKFFEYYDGTNFDNIIQSVIKIDKDFIYKEFLKLIKEK